MENYLYQLSTLAIQAGHKIMEIYANDIDVFTKQDQSPVTVADQLAEDIIVKGLKQLTPNIPIIAEELASQNALPQLSNKANESFYLVDPLDGTKEFINKNGEFTVNIALIKNKQPVIGVIFVPALNLLYVGDCENNIAVVYHLNSEYDLDNPINKRDISNANKPCTPFKMLASRSHLNKATNDYIARLKVQHGQLDILNIGSSLKLCYIAEGKADIYPRFGPTMEWDIAAGHAILNAAKGDLLKYDRSQFVYGKQSDNFKNPNFIAFSNKQQQLYK